MRINYIYSFLWVSRIPWLFKLLKGIGKCLKMEKAIHSLLDIFERQMRQTRNGVSYTFWRNCNHNSLSTPEKWFVAGFLIRRSVVLVAGSYQNLLTYHWRFAKFLNYPCPTPQRSRSWGGHCLGELADAFQNAPITPVFPGETLYLVITIIEW